MAVIRLDKYLADMGCGTRSEVKNFIRKGRVTINGVVVKTPDVKVDTTLETVYLDSVAVGYVEVEYYMLNKPQGVISATEDKKVPTVIDLIDSKNRKDLFPVGRLDKDTEGLLLITNDGPLAHNLLSPKKHVDKLYYVEVDDVISPSLVDEFEKGVDLQDGVTTRPANLVILDEHSAHLTIHEGKFHQVKRMFEAFGLTVTFLKRLQMGSLVLDESLQPGEYRALTQQELDDLKNAYK